MVKIFLSYKYEDKKHLEGFKGMILNPNTSFRQSPEHEREDYRHLGKGKWKEKIREIMKDCDVVICLIGNDTHNANGVIEELKMAKMLSKPIIPVRIKGTQGALPNIIGEKDVIPWDPKKINDEISRVLNTKTKI